MAKWTASVASVLIISSALAGALIAKLIFDIVFGGGIPNILLYNLNVLIAMTVGAFLGVIVLLPLAIKAGEHMKEYY